MTGGRDGIARLENGIPLLVALALTPAAFGKSPGVVARPLSPANNVAHSMHTAKHEVTGKIQMLSASRLELACPMDGKMEDTFFLLDPETQREGKITVGSVATVKYRLENNQKIASSVTARPSTSTASKASSSKDKT